MKSPFFLENETEYKEWRKTKLSLYPIKAKNLSVSFDINTLSLDNLNKFKEIIKKHNFAIYNFSSALNNFELRNFCSRLNLTNSAHNLFSDENDISDLTDNFIFTENSVDKKIIKSDYIPYTNKPLNWHTDGYYYPLNASIKSFVLHCVHPASKGGGNLLLDHEIMYIFLRDHNPEYISILMENNAMEIPKNNNNKDSITLVGPVFYIDQDWALNMRFTSRQHNIIWKKDGMIKKIKNYIYDFITNEDKYIYRLLLKKNQGYVANNILHKREEYTDDGEKRHLKRIRFLTRAK